MELRFVKNPINQAELENLESVSAHFPLKETVNMRPSNKSRNRNRNNRRVTSGNIVNRVFDSSGPEGRVRGTPQQVIEKYSALAHDAHLSGDRVAAENFMQHSEHYSRLLSEAQKENESKQEPDVTATNNGAENRIDKNISQKPKIDSYSEKDDLDDVKNAAMPGADANLDNSNSVEGDRDREKKVG